MILSMALLRGEEGTRGRSVGEDMSFHMQRAQVQSPALLALCATLARSNPWAAELGVAAKHWPGQAPKQQKLEIKEGASSDILIKQPVLVYLF